MDYKPIPVVDDNGDIEHWEIYQGKKFIASCNDNELNVTLASLDD